MFENITNFISQPNFKEGDNIILHSRRFNRREATIIKLNEDKKTAFVLTADGEEYKVDSNEIREEQTIPDIPDIITQSVEQDGEYRPVGNGTGKEREAFNVASSAMKSIQKKLGKLKVPIVGVRYESTNVDKWNNGINCLWLGSVAFAVEFLDINGVKHSATVRVPIVNGLVQEPKYMADNMNRKYAMDSDGLKNFLEGIDWMTDENDIKGNDEAVWNIPGQNPGYATFDNISFIKKQSYVDPKMIDLLLKGEKNAEINKKADLIKSAEDDDMVTDDELRLLRDEILTTEQGYETKDGVIEIVKEQPDTNVTDYTVKKNDEDVLKTTQEPEVIRYLVDYLQGSGVQANLNKKAEGEDKEVLIRELEEVINELYGEFAEIEYYDNISPVEYFVNWEIGDLQEELKILKSKISIPKKFSRQALYNRFAQSPWSKIKRIIKDEDDQEKMRELLTLRELIDQEIGMQRGMNEENGLDSNYKIDMRRRKRVNDTMFNILDGYENTIRDYFEPNDEKNAVINRVIRNIKAKNKKYATGGAEEEMDMEKEEEEKHRFKSKKTQQKPVEKQEGGSISGVDSAVPSGTGNREFNDMSAKDPTETKFVH
jgi:hypothetical protein